MPEYPVSGRVSYSARNNTRVSAPDRVDWVAEGLVTPAKDRNGGSSGVSQEYFIQDHLINTCSLLAKLWKQSCVQHYLYHRDLLCHCEPLSA